MRGPANKRDDVRRCSNRDTEIARARLPDSTAKMIVASCSRSIRSSCSSICSRMDSTRHVTCYSIQGM